MSAVTLLVAGLALMAAGYFVYSRFIAQKILKLDPNYETPSHAMQDGIDYVPTNKYVLWGHHFTSVAGARPSSGRPLRSSGAGCRLRLGGVRHHLHCRRA